MKIKQITKEQAHKIIETRKPIGKFWLVDGEKFVGIDNTDGDAWTEDFTDVNECIAWLRED